MDKERKEPDIQPRQEKAYPELIGIKQMTVDASTLTPEEKLKSDKIWDEAFEIVKAIQNGTYKRKTGQPSDTKK